MSSERKYLKQAYLTEEQFHGLKGLEAVCMETDQITLKLELVYKNTLSKEKNRDMHQMNEFICMVDEAIVGYAGICGFDGLKLEVSGMVHPAYRRQGIFTHLIDMVVESFDNRQESTLLLLSDSKSVSGQGFIKQLQATYDFSEYEMRLPLNKKPAYEEKEGILFRKASNADRQEIASQNAIYFDKPVEEINMPLPETEERRGMTIYLAAQAEVVIGKVNIQMTDNEAGIFGVGVRPEYRGQGYGRSLIEFALKKSFEAGANQVMLQVEAENENALSLYTSCGFKVVSKMDYYQYRGHKRTPS